MFRAIRNAARIDRRLLRMIQQLRRIGVIRSPFKKTEGTPIQPVYAAGAEGTIEIFPEFGDGLSDLDGFERIWLIYLFDRSSPTKLKVIPFRDNVERGLFATRAPSRPNPIGLSVVRLLGVDGLTLRIADLDILDGTPLLDIKPYISQVDSHRDSRAGWWGERTMDRKNADGRFGK
jgi:tRNA-Thr(GGU) m(6)t(6)A37 methyltransferase TsaA